MNKKTDVYIWITVILFSGLVFLLLNYLVPKSSTGITYEDQSALVPDGSKLILYEFRSPLNIVPNGNLVEIYGPFGTFKKEIVLCNPECKMSVYPGRNFPNITIEKVSNGIKVNWTSFWLRPRK